MTAESNAHDLWITLAQVVPVLALAYGLEFRYMASRSRSLPYVPKWVAIYSGAAACFVALGLLGVFVIALYSILTPNEHFNEKAGTLLWIPIVCAAAVFVQPAIDLFLIGRAKAAARHIAEGSDGGDRVAE